MGCGDERALYPAGLCEELTALERGEKIAYRVTDYGLFPALSDHSAYVSFVPADAGAGASLVWEVRFAAPSALRGFWEAFTAAFVGRVVANLDEVLQQPWTLVSVEAGLNAEPAEVLASFLAFTWRSGGGLPGPAPRMLSEGAPATRDGCTRLIDPPGLLERIIRVSEPADGAACAVLYTVDNPGLLTLYPVALHAGRVEFLASGPGQSKLVWSVRCLPLPGCGGFVELFTRLVIGTLAENLKSRLNA